MKQWLCYKYLHLLKKKSVDERNKYEPKNHKFTQLLFADHYGLSTPKSLFFAIDPQNEDTYITIIEKSFSYPFIAKDVEKDRWEGVFLINNRESLITILSNYSFQWLLFQEFIKNQGDLRIVVVWDAVVWAFKRYNPNSFKNNISGWGESEMVTISPELSSLCVDITKDFWLWISGIDFFNIDGDYILIEINSLPQYQWLELSTWINYIQEVFKYFKTLS
jgi:glutathione synthase/RimK-type ligase-like ATP-grasp enzyme